HPAGLGGVHFRVRDAERAFSLLVGRGGTPTGDLEYHRELAVGTLAAFSLATPFGDTAFRFVQRERDGWGLPGMTPLPAKNSARNRFGIVGLDHLTANLRTLAPALLWLEHVMGFERFWEVAFHTQEVSAKAGGGSGLKSVVMWDPESQVKFANNEPARPFFEASQVSQFIEDHRGEGFQHAALAVADILECVVGLRGQGLRFMPSAGAYYDALLERLGALGVGPIAESMERLRELHVLVDGDGPDAYLLQIFTRELAELFGSREAGPFFYELIERKGDRGFGAGNFRALFESIEREQSLRIS
ncbi:MAG TPA: VOC family protein, partial [Myxococcaceae bacterium]|nr:VOC family protein [Myxococcaceae bacterium]